MMPVDHFVAMNNRKYRAWNEEVEPRQYAIYQDEQEAEPEQETEIVEA
jgi:hypothetical protein